MERSDALSCVAPHAARQLDKFKMGAVGERTEKEVLQHYENRTSGFGREKGGVAGDVRPLPTYVEAWTCLMGKLNYVKI